MGAQVAVGTAEETSEVAGVPMRAQSLSRVGPCMGLYGHQPPHSESSPGKKCWVGSCSSLSGRPWAKWQVGREERGDDLTALFLMDCGLQRWQSP